MDNDEIIINFYNKKIKTFVAIFILAFLITSCYLLYQEIKLKKEISENCGFVNEDYRCYCDREKVEDIEKIIESQKNLYNFSEINISDE